MVDSETIRQEALRLLAVLLTNEPVPLSKELADIPTRPGLYAIRHKTQGLLYLGKSNFLRSRFISGHKAVSWAYLDRLDPGDIGISFVVVSYPWNRLLLELERAMLQQVQPPYNRQIPGED
jgi:excinuclease UvrABC nuclease subunit